MGSMAPKSIELGPLEIEVLGFLDLRTGKSVSEIQEIVKRNGKSLAYTTVMTVLSRLYEKGQLKREKNGRQFLYTLSPEKEKSRTSLFSKMKRSLFQHNRLTPFLALLSSDETLSSEELRVLKEAVDLKIRQSKGKS